VSLLGDRDDFPLQLPPRNVRVFDQIPDRLSEGYYVPLSPNFAAVDALTKDIALQYCITEVHPVKGVRAVEKLAQLYSGGELRLLFVVPESIAAEFKKQKILTSDGKEPAKLPPIHQFVAGLPLGIDASLSNNDTSPVDSGKLHSRKRRFQSIFKYPPDYLF